MNSNMDEVVSRDDLNRLYYCMKSYLDNYIIYRAILKEISDSCFQMSRM